jgi:SAM-dependent methyltransferase
MKLNWSEAINYLSQPGTNVLIDTSQIQRLVCLDKILDFLVNSESDSSSIEQLGYWESKEPNLRPPGHIVQVLFAEQRFKFLEHYIDFSQVQSALDVGCGNGVGTLSLKKRVPTVFGLDISSYLLKQVPDGIFTIRGDATNLPFKDKSLDFTMAWELIHHIPEPSPVFEELKRITKKWIVIFEPNRLNPLQAAFSCVVKKERLGLRNSKQFLFGLAEEAHLKIHHYSTVGCIFPNKYPLWLAKFASIIPFELPLIGISHVLIIEL